LALAYANQLEAADPAAYLRRLDPSRLVPTPKTIRRFGPLEEFATKSCARSPGGPGRVLFQEPARKRTIAVKPWPIRCYRN
jgi:hypothetical protein